MLAVQLKTKGNITVANTVVITGNLASDPELRFTPSGVAVANFTIADTPRYLDKTTNEWKDGDTLWMRCSIWREAAENVAESLTKGTRVTATGKLTQRQYEKDGVKHTVIEMTVDEIAPSLKYATARVTKRAKDGGAPRQQSGGSNDPWGNGNSYPGADDEPPF
jgi:single-strand DNA-binding protein